MLTKKKISFLFSVTLIFILIFGTSTYAAGAELDTPITDPQQVEYAILDSIAYGITFGSNGNADCHANGHAGSATKFVVSGTLHKYASDGHLDKICNWPERTINGQDFVFYEHALMVSPGEYVFTLYVDVYNGTQCENLVFYKNSTKSSSSSNNT